MKACLPHCIVQELWESRWRSWAVRPNEPSGFRGRKELLHRGHNLSLICQLTSEDIKHHFIIVLAAPSLEERPKEIPNLKSFRLFPSSREHVKGLLPKCTVVFVGLLQDNQICCLQACMCVQFSPEDLRAWAVKGLICNNYYSGHQLQAESLLMST